MPETEVVFYADEEGIAPALGWIQSLTEKNQDKAKSEELMENPTRTSRASAILRKRRGDNPEREVHVQEELAKLRLYQLVARMREESGLSQEDLARRMGTKQSVISRLESGDYNSITITTLIKAAAATGHRLRIEADPV
jgi:ribosome-binding protein aMBF1 (putative translation factor)